MNAPGFGLLNFKNALSADDALTKIVPLFNVRMTLPKDRSLLNARGVKPRQSSLLLPMTYKARRNDFVFIHNMFMGTVFSLGRGHRLP